MCIGTLRSLSDVHGKWSLQCSQRIAGDKNVERKMYLLTMDEVRSCGIAISFTCGCDERGLGHHQTIHVVLLSTK